MFSFFLILPLKIMKTIFITGASSGIGLASVYEFISRGWHVVATARNISSLQTFTNNKSVTILPLDVTDSISIENAVNKTISQIGIPDVLLNNAGYSVTGVFEEFTEHQMRHQFEVNVFGLMKLTQQWLPHFRDKKGGTIINIASVAGHAGFPTFSLYNSSKFAVEGFSESMWFELHPFGIKVKLVEPGPIKTDFYGRSMDISFDEKGPYAFMKKALTVMNTMGMKGYPPQRVAKAIFKAANSHSFKLRYPVGNAYFLIKMRHIFPHSLFRLSIRKMFGIK